MRFFILFVMAYAIGLTFALVASAQDRDMTMIEPTTTESGGEITNLASCEVQITDTSGIDRRIIPASAPTGGGVHTIDLTRKTGFTTVQAACSNTAQETGGSVSLTRTFPGDPPSSPTLRD